MLRIESICDALKQVGECLSSDCRICFEQQDGVVLNAIVSCSA
jgi:hypothetical protein